MASSARKQLAQRIDAIEAAYEFFLAYAAQGLRDEASASRVVGQLREHLDTMLEGVSETPGLLERLLADEDLPSAERYHAFLDTLRADAVRAGAMLGLVAAQTFPTSQLVDNLNASLHVRTFLTDLFLLDEALALGVASDTPDAQIPSTSPITPVT
jgi:hypothetical protein